jgi:hypothetical protein
MAMNEVYAEKEPARPVIRPKTAGLATFTLLG